MLDLKSDLDILNNKEKFIKYYKILQNTLKAKSNK